MNCDQIVQKKLLEAVRDILSAVSKKGLEGGQHFYITFLSLYSGVQVPEYLLKECPEEITIVLQYQFWDLSVFENFFSVGLSFNDQETKIVVPFNSLINVNDPSSGFNLDFDPEIQQEESAAPKDNIITFDKSRKKHD